MSFSAGKAAAAIFPAARVERIRRPASTGARLTNTFRVFPVVFFLSFFFSFAASAEITVAAKVGFHGVFQLGRPFPLEVGLANNAGPADGILEVQVWKSAA